MSTAAVAGRRRRTFIWTAAVGRLVAEEDGRRGDGGRWSTSPAVVEQDVRGQLAHSLPVLDACRHDLVDRKLKSSRTCVAKFDEVRVANVGDSARPVRRPAAEYVCNIRQFYKKCSLFFIPLVR